MFTDYYSVSPGMISQIPGKGAKYVIAFTDGAGAPLSGDASYKLNLPPNVPGRQLLVGDALRRRERLGPGQRSTLPVAGFA